MSRVVAETRKLVAVWLLQLLVRAWPDRDLRFLRATEALIREMIRP